jgi:hypothetical protein
MTIIADSTGVLGVIILLIAYFLLQTNKLKGRDYSYSCLNLIGSLMILYSVFYSWNLAAFIIEIAWALISLYAIWSRFKFGK